MASYAGTFAVTYDTGSATNQVAATFSLLVTALTACGLTQTADTGQVTAASIVNTTNPNGPHNLGYQLWQFTDALAGASPIILKLEYGDNNNVPVFWLTVGTGSDGAGNLTGTLSPRMFFQGALGDTLRDTSTLQTAYISGDGANASGNARVALAFCEGPTRFPGCFFSVERSVDSSGNDTSAGIVVHCMVGNPAGSNTNAQPDPVISLLIPYSGTLAGYQKGWISALNHNDTSLFLGSIVGTCLIVPFCFIPYRPGKNVMLYYTSDFPLYSSNTISVYGANHNYLALNQQSNTSPTGAQTPWTTDVQLVAPYPGAHILMRFE